MTTLTEITKFLNEELKVAEFSDVALNGLQIDGGIKEVSRIAFAVDSGLSVIEQATKLNAQLLIVHHGVYWGKVEALTGAWAKKASLCFNKGLSLYASHLPLDGHPIHGNAAQIATSVLNASDVSPDFFYHGNAVGVVASLPKPLSLEEIGKKLSLCDGVIASPLVLPFGKREIKTVGIVTGSGSFAIPMAVERGVDLLISGEPKQEAYHVARELECSVIFMGHYTSETFGVRALQRVLESRFGVETHWISEPTGI